MPDSRLAAPFPTTHQELQIICGKPLTHLLSRNKKRAPVREAETDWQKFLFNFIAIIAQSPSDA